MSFISLFPAEHSIFFDVFEWAGFEDDEEDNLGALQDRGWIVRNEEGYLIRTIVKGSIERQVWKGKLDEDRYMSLINELADTDQYMSKEMVYTKIKERIAIPETICLLLMEEGSERKNFAALLNNMAGVYSDRGDYERALEYYEKALSIREKVLGKEHPSTATTYYNMALVYSDQGDYERALEYYEKAIKIFEEKLGFEHPNTKISRGNLESLKARMTK